MDGGSDYRSNSDVHRKYSFRFLLKVAEPPSVGRVYPPLFWRALFDHTTPVKFAALSFSKNLTGRAGPQDTQRKHKFSLDRIYRISREVGVKYKQSSFAGKFQGCLNKVRFQVKVKINEFFNGGFQCSYQAILFGSHQHACGSS